MSQMSKAIMAIKELFKHRNEELIALRIDEKLFHAAYTFNKFIEDFELREPVKFEEIIKKESEEQARHVKQSELKIADAVKVDFPPSISTQPPKQTENPFAQSISKAKYGAKTVQMLANELHMSVKDTLLLLGDFGIVAREQGDRLSAYQVTKVHDYILKSAGNGKTDPTTAVPLLKQSATTLPEEVSGE